MLESLVTAMNLVQEFKINPDAATRSREFRIRLASWGAVILCFLISVLIFVLHVSGFVGPDPISEVIFLLTLLGGITAAMILSCREALRFAERSMIFVLNDNGIVRKRRGFPDLSIRFSEIKYAGEELRWLIIKSTEQQRKIAIPNDVSGYEIIRAELARHHPLDTEPLSNHASLLAWPSLWLIATIVSWSLFLWSHDRGIVVPAGLFAFISVIVGCIRLWKLLDRSPRR